MINGEQYCCICGLDKIVSVRPPPPSDAFGQLCSLSNKYSLIMSAITQDKICIRYKTQICIIVKHSPGLPPFNHIWQIHDDFEILENGQNNTKDAVHKECAQLRETNTSLILRNAALNIKKYDLKKENAKLQLLQETHSVVEPDPEQTSISTQTEYNHGDHYISHVEVIPIYDYASIKQKRKLMHREYSTVFKFFSRLIRIRYDIPVAVAVMK